MWRAYTKLGFLEYSFVETVEAMHPFYVIRALGGLLFLAGALIMVWHVWKTISTASTARAAEPAPAPAPGGVHVAVVETRRLREELDRTCDRHSRRRGDRRARRDRPAGLPPGADRGVRAGAGPLG